eukprot:jgi/Mesen1/2432/ME000157S01566
MSKPAWGAGAGSWAADAEEEENREAAFPVLGKAPASSFPSLGEAAAAKPKKKNVKTTLSLSEFTTGKYVGPGGKNRVVSESAKLTFDERLNLPTGPRERADEEGSDSLGGGFKGYGGFRGGGDKYGGRDGEDRDRDRGRDRGGFGRDRDGERDDPDMPSRADEASNWGEAKKFVPSGPGGGRDRDRYDDDRRGADRDAVSRADEVSNWGAEKKFVPSDRRDDRRSGFGERDDSSRADDVNDWGATKKFVPSADRGRASETSRESDSDRWARRDSFREAPREESSRSGERPRLVLQKRTTPAENTPTAPATEEQAAMKASGGTESKPKSNPFGAARPREEILAEKGQDWKKLDLELDSNKSSGSQPSSRTSSRPQTPDADAPKPRAKLNPFGEAKPREVLLEEKGKDWRKLDAELSHKAINRPESDEEKSLKEEIETLRQKLSAEVHVNGSVSESDKIESQSSENGVSGEKESAPLENGTETEGKQGLAEELALKEKKLEKLTQELDDKVRFSRGHVKGNSGGRGESGGRNESASLDEQRGGRWEGGRQGDDKSAVRDPPSERSANRDRDRGSRRDRESSKERAPPRREGGW